VKTIALAPLDPAKVGFKSNGTTLGKIPPRVDANNAPIFDFDTGCFPNILQSVVIKGNRAYLPAIGSSPNGPFRFNVNCQSVLAVTGEVDGRTVSSFAVLMPVVAVGYGLSRMVNHLLDRQRQRWVAIVISAVGAIVLILRQLVGF
jgi:hypothetical protein